LTSEQHVQTAQAVDREMSIERALQFTPPGFKQIVLTIAKIIAGIWELLNFRSPFVQKTINTNVTEQFITLVILRRSVHEIQKQRAFYQQLTSESSNQRFAELIDIMGKIIHALNNIIGSMGNALKADIRVVT
jgi:hypothetical protein